MKTEFLPSILNDVIGPVMRGPSSSHTAASWRIAMTGMQLLDDELEKAVIELEHGGVWASNYREQGTAMGMDGGLLGIDITDERIINPELVAEGRNISIEYKISRFEADHPNTVRITLIGKSGKKAELMAVSIGGGMFEIRRFNGYPTEFRGDSHDLIIKAAQSYNSEDLESIYSDLPAKYRVIQSENPDGKLIQVKSPFPFPANIKEKLSALPDVNEVILVDPILPVVSGNESEFPFKDFESMMYYASMNDHSLGKLGLMYECSRSGLPEKDLIKKMKEIIRIIENSIAKGLKGTEYRDRILHQQAKLIDRAARQGTIRTDTLVNRIISYTTALMESKSAMQVIVAVPTAGACGTFGGTVKAFCDTYKLGEKEKVLAYFAGGLIGVFFAMGPGFSAEEHGCQVETGAAACMAAAALVELSGGNYLRGVGAASMALQNSIGLICDPVADRVEVPCLGKNVTAGMNALAASTMVLSGFDPVIPLNQVINTVKQVGGTMPSALCNTGKGGLAITQRARELKNLL